MSAWWRRARTPGLRSLAWTAAAAAAFGCGGDETSGPGEPQPVPGTLRVEISSPVAVGGAVLSVTGGPLGSPGYGSGVTGYHDLSEGVLRAVVVAPSLAGEVLTFFVPDVGEIARYSVTVEQAADMSNEPVSPSSLTASVRR